MDDNLDMNDCFHVNNYQNVRAQRVQFALDYCAGTPVPEVEYTPEENDLWRTVFGKLSSLHEELACAQYRASARRIAMPADRVPQLHEVTAHLAQTTGFQLVPVAGIVPARSFFPPFAAGIFQTTPAALRSAWPSGGAPGVGRTPQPVSAACTSSVKAPGTAAASLV